MKSSPRILLVEDDPADVRLALAVLRELDPDDDIRCVPDGVAALDFLREQGCFRGRLPGQPAVILLDLKLPRINGFEVLEEVKADQRLRSIPVVVLTSSELERDLMRAYALGANSYVVKSIDFETYASCLRSISHYWTSLNQALSGEASAPSLPATADGA